MFNLDENNLKKVYILQSFPTMSVSLIKATKLLSFLPFDHHNCSKATTAGKDS